MNPESHTPRGLAVITGATGGVGLEIAKGLARASYAIVLGARSDRRGTEAVSAIRSVATYPDAIEHRPLDLASLASISAFVSALPKDPIDRLVLNAGVMLTSRKETEDGFEMMFGTNVLGHFALLSRVLDRVLAADSATIRRSQRSRTRACVRAELRPLAAYTRAHLHPNHHKRLPPSCGRADRRATAATFAPRDRRDGLIFP